MQCAIFVHIANVKILVLVLQHIAIVLCNARQASEPPEKSSSCALAIEIEAELTLVQYYE